MSGKIYASDLRSRECFKGCRKWAKTHGFNWQDFLDNGIDPAVLLATGDGMAECIVREWNGRKS